MDRQTTTFRGSALTILTFLSTQRVAMTALGDQAPELGCSKVLGFLNQVGEGMREALSVPHPTLIVAHGGVHWAICCLMGIQGHDWNVRNCAPVHFLHRSGLEGHNFPLNQQTD